MRPAPATGVIDIPDDAESARSSSPSTSHAGVTTRYELNGFLKAHGISTDWAHRYLANTLFGMVISCQPD